MQRILIVRLSAIGDVVMATGLLTALRQAHPQAYIAWLTEELGSRLLEGNPQLDALYVLPRRQLRALRREGKLGSWLRVVRELRRRLRDERFDTVLDLQGLLKSAVWGWFSGASRRIGLGAREHSGWLQTEIVDPEWDHKGRFCHEYRNMIEYLGLPAEPFKLSLYPHPEAFAKVQSYLDLLPAGRKPILLLPFTTRPQKHWFEERWSALAEALAARFGLPIWILGGPSDGPAAERIAAGAGAAQPVVIAGPATDLPEKMALLARASLAIGVDTGLTHMSLGLGTPTIALFGSTCPYLETDPAPGVVLYKNLPCAPCRRLPTCQGAFTCMRDIAVDEVMQAAERLLHDPAAYRSS